MKKGDKVTIENYTGIQYNIIITKVEDNGVYGKLVDITDEKPWLNYEYFFNTTDNGVIQYRILEPVELKPVYMDDGVIKFNTTSIHQVPFNPEPKQDLKDYIKKIEDAVPEDGDWSSMQPKIVKLGLANKEDVQDILNEFNTAYAKYGDFASFHEAFAVLLEEVDELWDHVKVKEKDRNMVDMRKETVQIAGMALKILHLFHKEQS